jgi:RimJ/RimL family protein N-acetyltransferase
MTLEEPSPDAGVRLRAVVPADIPIFFAQQLDAEANWMAAFTVADPADRDAFDARWARILADTEITARTILYGARVAGHIVFFIQLGEPSVSYWLGKEYWGHGIATRALAAFLDELPTRPLYARAASDNVASLRVLEKCGFMVTGTDRGYAPARGAEVDEFILKLEAANDA